MSESEGPCFRVLCLIEQHECVWLKMHGGQGISREFIRKSRLCYSATQMSEGVLVKPDMFCT